MVDNDMEEEEVLDESFEDFDEDFDPDLDTDEDIDLGDLSDESPSKSGKDDYLTDASVETALKANPKRAQARRKAARTMVEGVLNYAELSKPEGQLKAWEMMNEKTEAAVPKEYSLKSSFVQNDTIEHKKFGIGFVLEELSDTKISVLFEDGIRKLVCDNRNVE
tara:strand:- start:97 stop:588 length:492 start_codon:yes stop_codon:yes gene_type:complete